ncbi:MAG: hypothetical protein ABI898_05330 [Sphingomonadales bacterium]
MIDRTASYRSCGRIGAGWYAKNAPSAYGSGGYPRKMRFRRMKWLQKFASVHANVHNHFNLERHIVDRQTFKERRAVALAEWRQIAA